jgi:probable phosphoglycerate mutase
MYKTEIILVRHGQAVWNAEGRRQGNLDSPLSELGILQAKSVAEKLRLEEFSTIYTSDLGRAYRTARYIADASGHKVLEDRRLREQNEGVFEGLTDEEAGAKYPEAYQEYLKRSPDYAIPGGESLLQLQERAVGVFRELAGRHEGERLLVISHAGLLSAFIRYILGIPLDVPRRFRLSHASISLVSHDGDEGIWHVVTLGEISHLKQVGQ